MKEVDSIRQDRDIHREDKNMIMFKMNKQLESELNNKREIKRDYERNL